MSNTILRLGATKKGAPIIMSCGVYLTSRNFLLDRYIREYLSSESTPIPLKIDSECGLYVTIGDIDLSIYCLNHSQYFMLKTLVEDSLYEK